jgi:putative ABC transport system permease protein
MYEALIQSLQNLRANKLRSSLTMFGILWGIVSIIVLSSMGEGFRRGNDKVLRELGKNIVIIRRGRTSLQTGGERAGRLITLNVEDARALQRESRLLEVVSPEIMRGNIRIKSAFNAASLDVHGVEPQYQSIRTIELEYGRSLNWQDEEEVHRVALLGADVADQLFGSRSALGEGITIQGLPYTVVGKIRRKKQDSNYSGPDNDKIFVPFAAMQRDLPALGFGIEPHSVSTIIVTPKPWVVGEIVQHPPTGIEPMFNRDGIVEQDVRTILGRRHAFPLEDREAISIWNTTLETAMFDKMISGMRDFFLGVGFITLALGGIGVMNIMLIAVKDRTAEIGIRKAVGATTRDILLQFLMEGLFLTAISGGLGLAVALGICAGVNLLPRPEIFVGMVVTWEMVGLSIVTLIAIGALTSTYPAVRAAQLPPVEALQFER